MGQREGISRCLSLYDGSMLMNKRILICGVAVAALAFPISAQAEDAADTTIIVGASRADEPVEASHYAGSVTVLSSEQLTQRQTRNLAEALRDVPGVALAGTPGLSQLRLRGSEANHVLVLADGIELSNSFYGETDLDTLQAEIGASVEVLRGAQSALYGSDAIGGVIAYRSAGGCDRAGVSGYAEGGSYSTFNAGARAGLCGDRAQAAFSANFVSTDGTPNARNGTRDLGRNSLTLASKGSVDLSPNAQLRAALRYISTEGDFNNQDFDAGSPTLGLVLDTPGQYFENEAIYALVGVRIETLEGRWTHDVSGQIADVRRDTFSSLGRDSGNDGQRLKGSYVNSLRLDGPVFTHQLTFAADIERETYRNTDPFGFAFTGKRSARNVGLAGEYRASSDKFNFGAALRRDLNNRFADATTFRVEAGGQLMAGTRLRAAGGSGIKDPGFYELYGFVDGRFIGNQGLQPEKSTGWEIGIDQSLADDALQLSATWFDSILKHEIYTDFPPPDFIPTPANRTTNSKRSGLELSAHARIGSQVTLDAAYTWLDAEENGTKEVRRPAHVASAAVNWTAPGDAASATLVVRHNGASRDLAFTDPTFVPVIARLDDYTLVNLAAEVKLTPNVRLFARVENLLDERYEQVFSFVSQGRSVIAGVKVGL